MPVKGLDHVNIRTRDVQASARFYAELLDLTPRDAPIPFPSDQVQWLHDANGRPIIHLNNFEPCGEGPTGPIHHIALACTGKAEILARLERMGAAFEFSQPTGSAFAQIITRDPHGVLLELNFSGD